MKPRNPRQLMGVYASIEDVPERHRLDAYSDEYRGQDTWDEWLSQQTYSESYLSRVECAGRSWREHVRDRGRHHALARPCDVETWTTTLAESRKISTVYNRYYVQLKEFYDWLCWHTDHPHTYSPVRMAILLDGTTRDAYRQQVTQRTHGPRQ